MFRELAGKKYGCGKSVLEVGVDLFAFKDSSAYLGNPDVLRQNLAEDGYLYIKRFYEQNEMEAVQIEMRAILNQLGLIYLDEKSGRWLAKEKKAKMFQPSEYAQLKKYIELIGGQKIRDLFSDIRNKEIYTYPYKWLRAVPPGSHTGVHFDHVYMGRGSNKLLTCWTALEDIPLEKGGLLFGNKFSRFDFLREHYGSVDIDKLQLDTGWYSDDIEEVKEKFGGKWLSENFKAGDIVIFGMLELHGSLNNISDEYRLSCDTRFQGVDEARDSRWEVAETAGHSKIVNQKIADLKKEWDKAFVF